MSKQWQISRRAVLRGLGTAVALPMLDAMQPTLGLGATTEQTVPPRRMAFLMVPNGVHVPDWTPTTEGYDFKLPYILEPLARVQDELLVLTGLTHDKGRANGDSAGDHARACASFLTTPIEPGAVGTLCLMASCLQRTLSPNSVIDSALGPTNSMLHERQISAK